MLPPFRERHPWRGRDCFAARGSEYAANMFAFPGGSMPGRFASEGPDCGDQLAVVRGEFVVRCLFKTTIGEVIVEALQVIE